jgi:hypothetical protein
MKRRLLSLSEHDRTQYLSQIAAVTQPALALGRAAVVRAGGDKQNPAMTGKCLAQDRILLEKLATLLRHQNPPVTDLNSASQGFREFGQFVAAVHITHILGIPFEYVKTQMLTTEGLGKTTLAVKADMHR